MLKQRKDKGSDEEEETHSAPEQPDLSTLEEAIEAIDETAEDNDWDQAVLEREQIGLDLQMLMSKYGLEYRSSTCKEGVLEGKRVREVTPQLVELERRMAAWEAKWPQFADCIC